MHEPIGLSGVHTLPNSLQSVGFAAPRRIDGHSQPLTSLALMAGTSKRSSASKASNSGLMRNALSGNRPSPRHSNSGRSAKNVVHELLRFPVAVARDGPRVLVLHLTAAIVELAQQHQRRLHDIQGFKA